MPAIVKVRVVAARDLPIMDKSSESTDAFVEVKFNDEAFKTGVCRKSLCPSWNVDFRFEVEDAEIQNDVLEIKVYDHDSYSANDAIGKVYLDLSPLALAEGPNVLSGWHPIYDTLRGIRGEINLVVKLQIFNNENKFRDTSIGVKIFALSEFPSNYKKINVLSFVEELVVSTDPEYQWVDNFRTSRASNDTRVRLLYGLSGALKRKLGVKALELGGNAIIGYKQNFDIEGEYGLVARGIGTVVTLSELNVNSEATEKSKDSEMEIKILFGTKSNLNENSSATKIEGKNVIVGTNASSNNSTRFFGAQKHVHSQTNNVPFFTISNWKSGIVKTIGGIVTARSVKLLNKIKEPDEPETRDVWWSEIREEISAHARAIGCNTVIGYSERTSICDELCVLSATGTAAILSITLPRKDKLGEEDNMLVDAKVITSPTKRHEDNLGPGTQKMKSTAISVPNATLEKQLVNAALTAENDSVPIKSKFKCPASFTHVPYRWKDSALPSHLKKCKICKRKYVPELLLSSIEIPTDEQIVKGHGVCIEARVCRVKKKLQDENNAIAVSDALPFLEYDIHHQLLNKMKLFAMNSVFGLSIQVSVGETLITAVAVGTALFLKSLSLLPPIQIKRSLEVVDEEDVQLVAVQRKIMDVCAKNRHARMQEIHGGDDSSDDELTSSSSDEFEESADFGGLSSVLEIDDEADEDSMAILIDPVPSFGSNVNFTTMQKIPGLDQKLKPYNIQMVTSLHRTVLDTSSHINQKFSSFFHSIKQGLCFKLRRFSSCWVVDLKYEIEMNEDDEDISQIQVSAMVLGVEDDDLKRDTKMDNRQFVFDENKRMVADRNYVEMTTMNYIPGSEVITYLSHIEIFLIKENSIRETESLNNFIHIFVTEAYAIALAHVRSLGGNALFALKLRIIDSNTSAGYVLVMLSGDACLVSQTTPCM